MHPAAAAQPSYKPHIAVAHLHKLVLNVHNLPYIRCRQELAEGLPAADSCAQQLAEANMHYQRHAFAQARDLYGQVLDHIAEVSDLLEICSGMCGVYMYSDVCFVSVRANAIIG